MARYTCVKCGETAYSKCVASRSVFPNDQHATMIGNAWSFEANRKMPPEDRRDHPAYEAYSDAWVIKLEVNWFGEQSEDEALLNFFLHVRKLPEETLRHVLCKHSWRLDDEKCDLGCCTRK